MEDIEDLDEVYSYENSKQVATRDEENEDEEEKISESHGAKVFNEYKESESVAEFISLPSINPLIVSSSKSLTNCVLLRKRTFGTSFFTPTYELYLEGPTEKENSLIMIAQKKFKGKSMHFHIYDATKGSLSTKLNKKCGNYIGKLKSNLEGSKFVLMGRKERSDEQLELGLISFETQNIIKSMLDAPTPRKMRIVLPPSKDDMPLPNRISSSASRTLDARAEGNDVNLTRFQNKSPELEDGVYRLNFKGRVKTASVKNFQLSNIEDGGQVALQFGKVQKNVFHLDFQSPFTPMQAFAVALSQFDV